MPKYSIITVASNGLINTIKCIESIFAHTKDFELIVVDNNTNDGTEEWLDNQIQKLPNLRTIRSDKNMSFAENNNCGLQIAAADAQFIVFLNNDTVVSKDWLDRMEAHFKNVPLDNVGMVGPVCNNSNGRQMVGLQDPEAWYAANRGSWKQAGVLYGWCMMVRKSIIDTIGGFDERFMNSWEDNDLALRVQLAGYSLIIAHDVWIHHEGQGTLKQMWSPEQYMENGIKMREVFYDKYDTSDNPKKLVAVYRTNGGAWLLKSLEQTSKFADHILIHFCRAPEEIILREPGEIKKVNREEFVSLLKTKFPKISFVEFYDGIFQEDYERGRLLEVALQYQANGKADWCISIDDDEIYEDKFIGIVQKLMNPRDPQIMAYWANWRTIWDTRLGIEYFRSDSTFGQFTNYRFFRLIPGQKIQSHHPEGHHCGSAPWFGNENLRWTNIRVKHMGYDTPEQRQRKFEFYQANDHFKTRADIGFDDYSHLIDLNPSLVEYKPDHGISMTMMVKNDEKWIEGSLEGNQWLVDEFIIVDTGSTDKTRAIIERFAKYSHVPVKILDFPWCDNYSLPRNLAKRHATKPWVMFMDCDERFRPEQIKDIFMLSEADLDLIIFNVLNYLEQPQPNRETRTAPTQASRLFRNIPEFYLTGIVHETIDDSVVNYKSHHKLRGTVCAVQLHHYGYLTDKEKLRYKMDYYEILNKKQIEITEGMDPRPYFNMALHFLNDDKKVEAMGMFQKSLEIAPGMWHAAQQMAVVNMQSSKAFLHQALGYMPSTHPSHRKMQEILEYLESQVHGFAKVV